MATSKTIIISNSVSLLGHKPIQTLDNADDLVTSAEQAYDLLLPSVLSLNNWRFATTIQQLSEVNNVVPPPQTTWTTVYQLPAGYLKNLRIWPQSYQYEIYSGGLIYTNWTNATPTFMEYIFQPDEALFPPHFVSYFVWEIAAYLALSNAQKPEFYDKLEAKRINAQAVACAIEAQNRPQFVQVNFPVIDQRNFSEFSGNAVSA